MAGILDGYQFSPQGFGGQGGGLLDIFRMMQSAPMQQPQGFPDALPPNAQPTAGIAPQAMPPAPQTMQMPQQGFMGGLSDGIANNAAMLMALGGGMMSGGIGKGLSAGALAQLSGHKGSDDIREYEYARRQGFKGGLSDWMAHKRGVLKQSRAMTPQEIEAAGLPKAPWYMGSDGKPTLPQGYDTAQPKTEKVGAGETLYSVPRGGGAPTPLISGGPDKPPAGFEYADKSNPSKGLSAIPGGPATQMSAEAGGRMALMNSAIRELPSAKKTFMEAAKRGWQGGLTGKSDFWGDVAGYYTSSGEMGRAVRGVRLAVEGALRAATGAAAPEQEVKRYAEMFTPAPGDTEATAQQKLRMLDNFLTEYQEISTRGRRPAAAPNDGWQDAGGGVRIRVRPQ